MLHKNKPDLAESGSCYISSVYYRALRCSNISSISWNISKTIRTISNSLIISIVLFFIFFLIVLLWTIKIIYQSALTNQGWYNNYYETFIFMVKYLNSTWVFDLYLRQINIAHLNINQVLPVRYLEHLVFTTMKTTLANYTQIQSQVLST